MIGGATAMETISLAQLPALGVADGGGAVGRTER
jgi:hypothetical protein